MYEQEPGLEFRTYKIRQDLVERKNLQEAMEGRADSRQRMKCKGREVRLSKVQNRYERGKIDLRGVRLNRKI